jgi:hypothetical protein
MRQHREAGRRVRIPNEEDITNAFAMHPRRAVIAVAGTTRERLIYLNIGFRTGEIETVYLDERGVGRLIAALKALAPAKAGIAASPPTLEADGSIGVQEGSLFPDEEE